MPTDDLLNLRATSKELAQWVDTSVKHLSVSAQDVLPLLVRLSASVNLKHIETLRIKVADVEVPHFRALFPTIIGELSKIPHKQMHIDIITSRHCFSNEHLALLTTLSPASLRLKNGFGITPQSVKLLASLPYRIKLSEPTWSDRGKQN